MTIKAFAGLVAGAIIIVVAAALLLPMRGLAAEPVCTTEDQIIEAAGATGAHVVGAAYYDGAQTDTMLVIETADAIVIYGFRDGCVVGAMVVEPRSQDVPA